MPDAMWINLLVIGATAVAVVAVVAIHFEGMLLLGRHTEHTRKVAQVSSLGRLRMIRMVLGLIVLHLIEMVVFGLTLWAVLQVPGSGRIAGVDAAGLFEACYLSAATYSTVGFGDLAPIGAIRWLAGTEALVGLMMIAWSASFAYLEMARHWHEDTGA